mmetsp:Transcript_17844/g.12801  ORF Transcript_17844/g.12801 Transcript_17844/m.12801 type:complete len:224 (-) Transcript_17844:282-953(-)
MALSMSPFIHYIFSKLRNIILHNSLLQTKLFLLLRLIILHHRHRILNEPILIQLIFAFLFEGHLAQPSSFLFQLSNEEFLNRSFEVKAFLLLLQIFPFFAGFLLLALFVCFGDALFEQGAEGLESREGVLGEEKLDFVGFYGEFLLVDEVVLLPLLLVLVVCSLEQIFTLVANGGHLHFLLFFLLIFLGWLLDWTLLGLGALHFYVVHHEDLGETHLVKQTPP